MSDDSDDEINKLRAAALLTRPSNMRRRKVTLINPRNVGGNADKRKIIVNPRKVVVGRNSGSPTRPLQTSATAMNNDSDSQWPRAVMDSYAPKKRKLQKDSRILSVGEKQFKTEKDQRISDWSEAKNSKEAIILSDADEVVDFDEDVRIILNENSGDETKVDNMVEDENEVIKIDDDNELENVVAEMGDDIDDDVIIESEKLTVAEERLPLRKVELKNIEEGTGSDVEEAGGEENINDMDNLEEIESSDDEGDEKEDKKGIEEREKKDEYEQVEEEEQGESKGGNEKGVEVEKVVKDVKVDETGKSSDQKEQKSNVKPDNVKDEKNVETTTKKKLQTTNKNKQSNEESLKSDKKEKDESRKKKQKATDISVAATKEKKSKDDSSDVDSSGSESDSSASSGSSSSPGSSSSSSSYSSSSSSPHSSSDSRSSSDSDSNSEENDKESRRSRNSSRRSSQSSSYSYSTGGSVEKNTMRSVVSHKDKDSRRSRSPRRSPRRRSPRRRLSPGDRRYSDRRRSHDRDGRYRRDRYGKDTVRDLSPKISRRGPPHSRLGWRASPSRYYQGNRGRSGGAVKPRDARFNRRDERPRHRRRTRSKSVEERNGTSNEKKNYSDKNNLSRTDDDFVEIVVEGKPDIKESKLKTFGRLDEKTTSKKVRKPGFDLRSRLGPKKSETKRVITKKIEVDARQELERQNQGKKVGHEKREARLEEEEEYKDDEEQDTGDNDDVVEVQDVKEAEIDAKILRIQRKNEEIRKRQEEIERDKMMHL